MKKKIFAFLCLFLAPLWILNAEEDWEKLFNEKYGNDLIMLESSNSESVGSKFKAALNVNDDSNVDGINGLAGNNVNANGNSEYGAFAGNILNIEGSIEKELFVLGNEINFKGNVGRDAYLAGNIINLSGSINRNVFIAGSNIVFSDVVINGDIKLFAEEVEFKDNVIINGNIKYNDDATITGIDTLNKDDITTYHIDVEEEKNTIATKLLDKLISLASLLVIAYILYAVFPNLYTKLNKKFEKKSLLHNFLLGIGILIITPIVLIITLFTVIGSPLALIVLALYIILCYIGKLTVLSIIGNNIYTICLKKKDNPYISILIGLIVYYLVSLIPIVGGIIKFVILVLGFGYSKELIFNSKK